MFQEQPNITENKLLCEVKSLKEANISLKHEVQQLHHLVKSLKCECDLYDPQAQKFCYNATFDM